MSYNSKIHTLPIFGLHSLARLGNNKGEWHIKRNSSICQWIIYIYTHTHTFDQLVFRQSIMLARFVLFHWRSTSTSSDFNPHLCNVFIGMLLTHLVKIIQLYYPAGEQSLEVQHHMLDLRIKLESLEMRKGFQIYQQIYFLIWTTSILLRHF